MQERSMADGNDGTMENACRSIFEQLERSWEWDERFGCVLTVCEREPTGVEVIDVLTSVFATALTFADAREAQSASKELVQLAGGLQPGQRFWHSDMNDVPILYASFWPWGDGKTVSVRIGIHGPTMSNDTLESSDQRLKACFAVG